MKVTSLWTCLLVWCVGSVVPVWCGQAHADRRPDGWQVETKEHKILRVRPKRRATAKIVKRKAMQASRFERFAKIQLYEKLRTKIRDLKQIIQYAKPHERAGLWFRLAEHYWESGRHHEFQGHKLDAYRGKPEWPQKKRLQTQAWKRAKQFRRLAAGAYFRIIKQHPRYKRLCEAYYFLGKNLVALGQAKQALQVYRTMIKRFANKGSQCPFIPSAYLAFAEYYFNNGQVRTALQSYRQVLHFPRSSIYGFALYKVAWCQYNLAQYRLALRSFVEVARFARKPPPSHLATRRVQLLREALRDLVLAYSQVGIASEAHRLFQQWGGTKYKRTMLRNLGALYREQGKFPQIVAVYRVLQQLDVWPRSLVYQLYIAQALDRYKPKARVLRAVKRLASMTVRVRQKYPRAAARKAAEKEIEPQLAEWATHLHYTAQKTRRKSYYRQAAAFYAPYLLLYPKSKRAYKMGFHYAEVLFLLGKYEAAGKHYEQLQRRHKGGKFAQDIAYNPILAYDRLLQRRGARKVLKRRWRQAFLRVSTRYLKRFPKGKRAVDVAYRLGRMHYEHKEYKQATRQFDWLIKRFPLHKYARYSAHTLLDMYNLQERWGKLAQVAAAFAKRPTFAAKDRRRFRAVLVQARIKRCKRDETRGKLLRAARCYRDFASRHVQHKTLGPAALYNGSLLFHKARRVDEAIALRVKLLRRFPSSTFARGSLLALAAVFAKRAQFRRAAGHYEQYLQKYKAEAAHPTKRKVYTDARLRAGLFREAAGDKAKALLHYQWLHKNPWFQEHRKKGMIALFFRVAALYKTSRQERAYARLLARAYDRRAPGRALRRMLPAAWQVVAQMKHATLLRQQGVLHKASRLEAAVVQRFPRLPKTPADAYTSATNAVAEASFRQAQAQETVYQKISFGRGLGARAIKRIVAQKRKALRSAWAAHQKVLAYKQGTWGVAALCRAGALSLDFAAFLREVPTPPDAALRKTARTILRKVLTTRGVARRFHRQLLRRPRFRRMIQTLLIRVRHNYRRGLARMAQPYRTNALHFFQRSLALAHRLYVYNKWTLQAQRQLATLRPHLHPGRLEALPVFSFASSDFAFSDRVMGRLRR